VSLQATREVVNGQVEEQAKAKFINQHQVTIRNLRTNQIKKLFEILDKS
jgi:hypothetical protein